VNRIIGALPDRLKPLVKFIAETGCRSGEVFNLTWRDIDEVNGIAHIRPKEGGWSPKTSESARRVPLGASLLASLSALPKKGKCVFPGRGNPDKPINNIRKALRSAIKRAKVFRDGEPMHITPHILRKAYITWQIVAGKDMEMIQRLIGHKKGSKTTARHYIHFSDDEKQAALLELPEC